MEVLLSAQDTRQSLMAVCNTVAMTEISVRAQWLLDAADIPVPANQCLVQIAGPTAYVIFGHINPPTIDDPDVTEFKQEMLEGRVFPVIPVARVQMPVSLLMELREKIDGAIAAAQVKS